jgi:hypothetical protein
MPTTGPCAKPLLGSTTWPGNCILTNSPTDGDTLSANTQIHIGSGGFAIQNKTVHLSPGTYWITDGNLDLQSGRGATLDCPSCTPGGDGVTIILTTAQPSGGTVGSVTLNSNSTMTLNAPKTGTFAGLVLIQDSNGLPPLTTINSPSSFPANSNAMLNGLVYFPNTDMTFQGTPAAGSATCVVLVVRTLSLAGNAGFNSTGCSNAGLSTLPTPKMVALGE